MSGMIVAGLWSALAMLAPAGAAMNAPANAAIQQDDDWEFAADPARNLSVASVRYGDGQAIVAQCQGAEMKLVIVGLPATTENNRILTATRADGRHDTQVWTAEVGATAFSSTVTDRDARFLRGGGMLELRTPAGKPAPLRANFDLPTQNANLDRVLTACGVSLSDDRDLLQRAGDDLKTAWQAEREDAPSGPTVHARSRSRSVSGATRRPAPPPPAAPQVLTQADVSCLVRNATYADCRLIRATVGTPAAAERQVREMNGTKLEPVSAAANEGRVIYITVTGTRVVIDHIATRPG